MNWGKAWKTSARITRGTARNLSLQIQVLAKCCKYLCYSAVDITNKILDPYYLARCNFERATVWNYITFKQITHNYRALAKSNTCTHWCNNANVPRELVIRIVVCRKGRAQLANTVQSARAYCNGGIWWY